MMEAFYRNFKLAYPEAWARITRDLTPAQRAGLAPLPDFVASRCSYFLRYRQHRESRVASRDWCEENGVRFESLPDNA